jgi:hypothetical protein
MENPNYHMHIYPPESKSCVHAGEHEDRLQGFEPCAKQYGAALNRQNINKTRRVASHIRPDTRLHCEAPCTQPAPLSAHKLEALTTYYPYPSSLPPTDIS